MIETERLILRPFIMEDATDVFEYLNEPLVNCFACMKLNTIEESNKHLQEAIKYVKENTHKQEIYSAFEHATNNEPSYFDANERIMGIEAVTVDTGNYIIISHRNRSTIVLFNITGIDSSVIQT